MGSPRGFLSTRVPPTTVLSSTKPGRISLTSPMIVASAPYLVFLTAETTASAVSPLVTMTAFPSQVTSRGSRPSISEAARTLGLTGILSASSHMLICDLAAISFSAMARPPRVGSFMQWTSPALWAAAVTSCMGATSEVSSVWKARPSRFDMRAMPWSPTVPVTITLSPGRAWLSSTLGPLRTPTPVVLMIMPSRLPLGMTLKSPAIMATPASLAAAFMDSTMARSFAMG